MGQIDQRTEDRTKAVLRARLRGSGLDRDACILDLSEQGLLLTAAMPPRRDQAVTIVANGYAVTGHVRWVNERRFGISLDAPIVVSDVVEGKILAQPPRAASPGLPENFGARPVSASASLTLNDYIQSKWTRYALMAAIAIAGAIYVGREVGEVFGGMSEQMEAVQAVSNAESDALSKQ